MRTVLLRELATARRALAGDRTISDAHIHAARKALKRARAALRLLRRDLGRVYVRENAALRKAARPLSELRDMKVLLDSVQRLRAGDERNSTVLREFQEALRKERRELLGQLKRPSPILDDTTGVLNAAARRISRARLRDDAPLLFKSLARVYRRGRKAVRRAMRDPSNEKLHEARKQVKYTGAALAICADMNVGGLQELIESADKAGELLGDGHDLAILQDRLESLPADCAKPVSALTSQLTRSRKELAKRAIKHGRRLYRRRPRAFARRVASG